jgi:oligopeptide transport system ATP-binding protein
MWQFKLWRPLMLEVNDLRVQFKVPSDSPWPWAKAQILTAVDGVSFDLQPGETLGIVGESGCGKSTLARGMLNLVPVHSGSVRWQGLELIGASNEAWMAVRRDVQMIFQDPLACLNPRMTVMQLIAEPLRTHERVLSPDAMRERVVQVMKQVGLSEQHINRYPHEFSGGQCQRIGIARALILKPKLIVCDEPVSALDVSIQAQIINLLKDLQQSMGLALIFIAHNLAVVKHISDRVMVMYLGRAVELATTPTLFAQPQHPYTQALLAAIPEPDPKAERAKTLQLLHGDLPSPIHPPSGCRFRTRCPKAQGVCAEQLPELRLLQGGSQAACTLL